MSTGQQMFTVVYAVLFGSMLSSLRKMYPFPWGLCVEKQNKHRLVVRLIVSLIVLNVVPILILACGVTVLKFKYIESYWDVVFIGLSALTVFAPYRFFHLLIVCMRGDCFSMYSRAELRDMKKERGMRLSFSGYLLGVIVYSSCALFWFLV